MAIPLVLVGIMFLVVAVRGTQDNLFSLLKGDLTGQRNFIYWIIAILVIGAIGYVPKMRSFSNAFLVLIAVAILLSNKGFFNQFQQQIGATQNG